MLVNVAYFCLEESAYFEMENFWRVLDFWLDLFAQMCPAQVYQGIAVYLSKKNKKKKIELLPQKVIVYAFIKIFSYQ